MDLGLADNYGMRSNEANVMYDNRNSAYAYAAAAATAANVSCLQIYGMCAMHRKDLIGVCGGRKPAVSQNLEL